MHRQMMQNPMHRSTMMAYMLPALADTLGLSEQEKNQMESLKRDLKTQLQSNQEQRKEQKQELKRLFEGENQPSATEVRQHLEEMASLRADRQASIYETAEQMRQMLTEEQRQRLEGMSPQDQMQYMMAEMSMMDMMQMRQAMHGEMMAGSMMNMGPGRMGPDMNQRRSDEHMQRDEEMRREEEMRRDEEMPRDTTGQDGPPRQNPDNQ